MSGYNYKCTTGLLGHLPISRPKLRLETMQFMAEELQFGKCNHLAMGTHKNAINLMGGANLEHKL